MVSNAKRKYEKIFMKRTEACRARQGQGPLPGSKLRCGVCVAEENVAALGGKIMYSQWAAQRRGLPRGKMKGPERRRYCCTAPQRVSARDWR